MTTAEQFEAEANRIADLHLAAFKAWYEAYMADMTKFADALNASALSEAMQVAIATTLIGRVEAEMKKL